MGAQEPLTVSCVSSPLVPTNRMNQVLLWPLFPDEETEAQRGFVSGLGSHSC